MLKIHVVSLIRLKERFPLLRKDSNRFESFARKFKDRYWFDVYVRALMKEYRRGYPEEYYE